MLKTNGFLNTSGFSTLNHRPIISIISPVNWLMWTLKGRLPRTHRWQVQEYATTDLAIHSICVRTIVVAKQTASKTLPMFLDLSPQTVLHQLHCQVKLSQDLHLAWHKFGQMNKCHCLPFPEFDLSWLKYRKRLEYSRRPN